MAEIDVIVRDTIWSYFVLSTLIAIFIMIMLTDSATAIRRKFLRWLFMKEYSLVYDNMIKDIKSALFADLGDIESRVIDLRNKGVIRVLEIGVGAGSNLKYYPQQCRLVVVDPSLYFKQYFEENRSKFRDIYLEQYVVSSGEYMKGVKTNSVDVVVTTSVLCSVEDVGAVLKEIRRVLVPGGRYYFLEHFLDEHQQKRARIQTVLTKTGIWPWLFDGCRFHPLRKQITFAGFSNVDYKEFTIDGNDVKNGKVKLMVELMGPHIVGVAKK